MRGAGRRKENKCEECGHLEGLHHEKSYCTVKKCKCSFFKTS
jgi:hypothetical protein